MKIIFILTFSIRFSYVDPNANTDPITAIESIIKWYATLGASSIAVHWIAYALWVIQ